jgi:hypothetical protein
MRQTTALLLGVGVGLGLACGAWAVQLSSPLGAAPKPSGAGATPSTAAPTTGRPMGQGAGVHSPNSPFAPLSKRSDVVPWSVLTNVSTRIENRRVVQIYPAAVQALDKKQVRIQGYMMPLGPGEMQWHFLLASVPLTCSFCVPGGPESMVEVRTREPVRYSLAAVVVEGRLQVLQSDPLGLYYRITGAAPVK